MSSDISLSQISGSLTLEGIDLAVAALNYTNPTILKTKYILAIKGHYTTPECVNTLSRIDQDSLIRDIWSSIDDPDAVRAKRKNLNSIRSTVNSDLNRLYESGDNPEGITIGPDHIFVMSENAKNDRLNAFSHSIRSDASVDIEKISDVLNLINDFISNYEGTQPIAEGDRTLENIKKILSTLTNMAIDDGAPGPEEAAIPLDEDDIFEELDDEDVEIIDEDEAFEEIEDEDVELIDEDELDELTDALDPEADSGLGDALEDIDALDAEIIDDEELEEIDDEELEEIDDEELEEIDDEDVELVDEEDLDELTDALDPEAGFGPGDALEDIDDLDADMVDDEDLEIVDDEELEEIDDEDVELVDEEDLDELTDALDPEAGFGSGDALEDIDNLDADMVDDEDLEIVDDEELEEIDDEDVELVDEEDVLESGAIGGQDPTGSGIPDEAPETPVSEEERSRQLAEQFERQLNAMARYYNNYLKIPQGEYLIGSPNPHKHELPERRVWIQDFFIGKFPITNSLFEIFITKTGYRTTAEKTGHGLVYSGRFRKSVDKKTGQIRSTWNSSHSYDVVKGACWYKPEGPDSSIVHRLNHPVVQVSQDDALAFAAWIGKTLPTEMEWEAAARTEKGYAYPWGNQWMLHACNMEESAVSGTTAVDHYMDFMNDLHLVDLLGNVLEWTCDTVPSPYGTRKDLKYMVAKGGSFISGSPLALWSRFVFKEGYASNIVGFRCSVR